MWNQLLSQVRMLAIISPCICVCAHYLSASAIFIVSKLAKFLEGACLMITCYVRLLSSKFMQFHKF